MEQISVISGLLCQKSIYFSIIEIVLVIYSY